MDCPNEETLQALAEGRLAAESTAAYQHLESCESCRLVMKELARSFGSDEEPLRAGQRLGVYRLVAPLGKGGMGVVWRAEDVELGRAVAVKLVAPPLADDEDARARFAREAKAAAALDHRHLGAVFGTGEHQGRPYLVMAYYEGETLKQRLKRDRPALDEALQILAELADGLAAVHARGLVHRDVKPSNVMLTPGGVRLLDFGLAKWVAPDETLTRTGELVGTLAYMAPEQLHNAPVDPRADVWSFGVVAYELCAGALPFTGTPEQIALAMNGAPPPPLRARNPRLPRDLERLVQLCLEKDPGHRYASAIPLGEDLRRVRAGEPLRARRAWGGRLVGRARRNRPAAALALLALLALGAAAAEVGARRASARRLERAHELGSRVERTASALRQARLLPTHDLTPARDSVTAAIADVARERARLAPEGTATCARAVGDGYLALGEYDKARGELERAWQLGERGPDAAYALGVDLAYLYRKAIRDAQAVEEPARRQAREHEVERELRDPAIAALRVAMGAPGVSAPYVEALIANAENRKRDSFEAARRAFAEQPTLFEAGQLAAADLAALATQAWNAGRKDEARRLSSEAADTWRRVLDIARSDEESYRVYADYTMGNGPISGTASDDVYQRVTDACERAVQIDPKSRALAIEAFVWAARAWDLPPSKDPRPLIARGEAIAVEARRRNPENWQADWALGSLLGTRGGWESQHALDPRPALERAIAALDRAFASERSGVVATAQAANLLDLAAWEAEHGLDPHPRWERVARLVAEYDALDPDSTEGQRSLGSMWAARARYDLEHGGNPEAALAGCDSVRARLAKMDATSSRGPRVEGMCRVIAAEWRLATGGDPRPLLDGVDQVLTAATTNDPAPDAPVELARSWLVRARSELARGADARPSLAAARRAAAAAEKADHDDPAAAAMTASVELWAARADRAGKRDPRPALQGAQAAVARALAIAAEDARALTLRGAIAAERAELPGGVPARALDAAIADCRHAQAIDARLAPAFAVEARLLDARARLAPDAERAPLAARAEAARRRADTLDPKHVYAAPLGD